MKTRRPIRFGPHRVAALEQAGPGNCGVCARPIVQRSKGGPLMRTCGAPACLRAWQRLVNKDVSVERRKIRQLLKTNPRLRKLLNEGGH